jgi:hypothetical protein
LGLTVKRPKVRNPPESLGVLLHNWLAFLPRSVDSLSNICQMDQQTSVHTFR